MPALRSKEEEIELLVAGRDRRRKDVDGRAMGKTTDGGTGKPLVF